MKQKLNVLLADDHKLLRAGLKLLLQRNPDFAVVGEAADGEQTLQLFQQLEPDLLLLDLSMPKMDGLDCLREIKSRWPGAKVIVLTMHEDENYIKQAMQAGAAAYVHKSAADTHTAPPYFLPLNQPRIPPLPFAPAALLTAAVFKSASDKN